MKDYILNPTEKKRYQLSSEYFSRGAASELKKKFRSNQIQSLDKTIESLKEDEADGDRSLLKNRLLILSVLAIGGVALFKKLNDKFPKLDTTRLKEVFTFDTSVIDSSLNTLKKTIVESYQEGFDKPLIGGLGMITAPSLDEVSDDLKKGLNSQQLAYGGVFGQVLYNLSLGGFWHLFEKRGYHTLLNFLDFPRPDRVIFDVSMWMMAAADPTQYSHVGRDLVNNSIKGADIVAKSSDVVQSFGKAADYFESHVKADKGSIFNTIIGGYVSSSSNLEEVLSNFNKSTTFKREFEFGPTLSIKSTKELGVLARTDTTTGYVNPETHVTEDWANRHLGEKPGKITSPWVYHKQGKSIVTGESMSTFDVDKMEYNKSHGEEFNKMINFIEETLRYSSDEQFVNLAKPIWKSLLQDGKRKFEFQSIHNGEHLWTNASLLKLLQFGMFISQYELYQALDSVKSVRGLYQEIFEKQELHEFSKKLAKKEHELRSSAEDFQIAYAKGQLTLQQVIEEIQKGVSVVLSSPLKWVKDDLRLSLTEIQKQIPYEKIKEAVSHINAEILKGVGGSNVLMLDNSSLKDNFDLKRRATVDTNDKLSGQQFDKKAMGREVVYSSDGEIYGREGGRYVARWNKGVYGGTHGENPLEFVCWEWVPNGHSTKPYVRYESAKRLFRNDDGGTWDRYSKMAEDPRGKDIANGDWYYYKVKLENGDTQVFGEQPIGRRIKTRYETLEDGKFYLVDAWDYYDNDDNYITSVEAERKQSLKSHAATYQGEYEKNSLDELYSLPMEVLEKNLCDTVDYLEEKLKEAYEQRAKLISSIVEKSQNVTINGKIVKAVLISK